MHFKINSYVLVSNWYRLIGNRSDNVDQTHEMMVRFLFWCSKKFIGVKL